MRSCLTVLLQIVVAVLLFAGCSTPPRTESTLPPKPELTIQVAALNYSAVNRRIEKKDVAQFAKVLRREQVDVLAVRGLVRYPGLATRVDLLTELAAQADLRTAFGEMMNNSGRQTGNAVFSLYPIQSSHSQPFEGVKVATVESALRATIDAGVHSISIVSAEIPEKANAEEQAQCAHVIESLDLLSPVIAAGNLPPVTPAGMLDAAPLLGSDHLPPGTGLWYTRGVLKPVSVRIVHTDLGPLLIGRFEVYRAAQP